MCSRRVRVAALVLLWVCVGVAACAEDNKTSGDPTTTPDVASVEDTQAGTQDLLDADDDTANPQPTNPCSQKPPDWSRNAALPAGGDRRDICQLGDALGGVASEGLSHALVWPVDVSGVLLPWPPLQKMLDPNATDDTTLALQATARDVLEFGTTDEMYDWLGLARFDGAAEAMPGVSWPSSMRSGDAMGAGIVQTQWGEALTFSCAACHTANMFGKTVVGLTNRRAQANAFFHLAGTFFPDLSSRIFQSLTGANADEVTLYKRAQQNFGAVGSKLPQAMGLDTSLAQVSLSLSKRAEDPWATQDPALQNAPRPNDLETLVADSKPAVWWTLKYKTRWLSDGSIVSGNPVHTNFLWNELGRGTDLQELSTWLKDNQAAVDALTVAVFATSSPRWTDFFGVESLDIDAARRGQAHYQNLCSTCHGVYEKAWDLPNADALTPTQRQETVRLNYHPQTPVLNVGTDPQRAAGMASFASRLNELAISQELNTVVEVQTGYVPPPLDGIWARYPYLHNQSVPTLCDLLSPTASRTPEYWMGPDLDPATDYDADCVGLPTGTSVPDAWKENPRNRFDASLPGLSNAGHDAWLTLPDGSPALSDTDRADLIMFLKTL